MLKSIDLTNHNTCAEASLIAIAWAMFWEYLSYDFWKRVYHDNDGSLSYKCAVVMLFLIILTFPITCLGIAWCYRNDARHTMRHIDRIDSEATV